MLLSGNVNASSNLQVLLYLTYAFLRFRAGKWGINGRLSRIKHRREQFTWIFLKMKRLYLKFYPRTGCLHIIVHLYTNDFRELNYLAYQQFFLWLMVNFVQSTAEYVPGKLWDWLLWWVCLRQTTTLRGKIRRLGHATIHADCGVPDWPWPSSDFDPPPPPPPPDREGWCLSPATIVSPPVPYNRSF